MADKPPLTYEEVRRVLHLLDPLLAERRIILVGGQAVAFWGRYLAPRSLELTAAGPLTSKDIDFEGSAHSVSRAATLLAGRPKIATMDDHTPNTGIVLFTDGMGTPREIDFIDAPLGLGARDVRDTAVLLALDADADQPPVELWIMHPERCMESRVINTTVLSKTEPLAIRQLATSVLCAREWSAYILDSDEIPEGQRVRAALNLSALTILGPSDDFYAADAPTLVRLGTFLNLYGFARNMSLATLIVAGALLAGTLTGNAKTGMLIAPGWWAVGALVASVGLLYRYLKFLRQYSVEMFVGYAESEAGASCAPPAPTR